MLTTSRRIKVNVIFWVILLLNFLIPTKQLDAKNNEDLPPWPPGTYQSFPMVDGTIHHYKRPKFWDFITLTPTSFKNFYHESKKPENLKGLAWITASTLLLYYYDRELLNGAQEIGRNVGLGNSDHTRAMIKIGKLNIFRGPTDIGSSMYFIGDGWTHMGITFSYILYGYYKDNYRALSTGSNLLHGIFFSTILNQFLKRTTGRESPYRATTPRGRWQVFPNQNEYNKNISKYDAFPSGHLATATVTLTVVLENYPEHRYWVLPAGVTLLGLLSYQMMNNGVHWASDYPLAWGMGYLIGKISANYGKKVIKNNGKNQGFWENVRWVPYLSQNGRAGIYLNTTF